ncbi:MAG: insulinase family protein [Cyanobacteria bacterium REEB65]|nr:insulinase family protein [Cyanobacteria bacterium REEB65]
MRVAIQENPSWPVVALDMWIHSGGKHETDTLAGCSHDLEHLTSRGTSKMPPLQDRLDIFWVGARRAAARGNRKRAEDRGRGAPSLLRRSGQRGHSLTLPPGLRAPSIRPPCDRQLRDPRRPAARGLLPLLQVAVRGCQSLRRLRTGQRLAGSAGRSPPTAICGPGRGRRRIAACSRRIAGAWSD